MTAKSFGDPAIKTLIHGTKMGLVGPQMTQTEGNENEKVAPETSKYVPQEITTVFFLSVMNSVLECRWVSSSGLIPSQFS